MSYLYEMFYDHDEDCPCDTCMSGEREWFV